MGGGKRGKEEGEKGLPFTRYMYAEFIEKEYQQRCLIISSLSKRAHVLCACYIKKWKGPALRVTSPKRAIPKTAKKDGKKKKASEGVNREIGKPQSAYDLSLYLSTP